MEFNGDSHHKYFRENRNEEGIIPVYSKKTAAPVHTGKVPAPIAHEEGTAPGIF
jgi:hypothetical protein